MDLKGSLTDTNLRIYPTKALLDFLTNITPEHSPPINILKLKNVKVSKEELKNEVKTKPIQLSSEDIKNLNRIREVIQLDSDDTQKQSDESENEIGDKAQNEKESKVSKETSKDITKENNDKKGDDDTSDKDNDNCKQLLEHKSKDDKEVEENFLTTFDIDWLYEHMSQRRKKDGANVPFLHELLSGACVEMPDNKVLKRNPVLEARCVKLRAQQEAREYRKMTRSVDNVRMRFPEDSINYQLKQVNRQLIAIGQFIISIFAGFLFGFRGVEWMVGNLDFGFRLLLGVMCALVIALAEIYFLAKKLNEELNVPETVQLGGPPKFTDDAYQTYTQPRKAIDKEHQD